MIATATVAVMMGTLLAGAVAMRSVGEEPSAKGVIVPVASSNAHRPDALGNYGGLKRRPASPSIRTRDNLRPKSPVLRTHEPPALRQPYPSQYYQDTRRGNYGCHWLARRATETNNLNWWTRYRSCSRKRTDFERPSYSPQR